MGISCSYDSPASAIAFANGSRSIPWLTPDEGKCCDNGAREYFACVCVSVWDFVLFLSLCAFLCQVLSIVCPSVVIVHSN